MEQSDRLIAGGKLIKSDKDELEYNSSIVFIYPSLIMIEDGRFLKILDRKVQIQDLIISRVK